ncbi:T9SS-dependent choice-of-anchor J family protein [Rurimicrobium arvi]|uniref:Secretion system C-terminal sorting domain-containing protein n=1 Tax=Rurimicrobium arvi TaxID=2049916 RepID=A0ABP8MMA3_9BACT
MKKLLLAPALLLAMHSANAQLALEGFNAATLPSGWMLFGDGSTVSTSITPTYIQAKLNASAWALFTKATGDSALISTSYYTGTATADRWVATPAFMVPSTTPVLKFDMGDLSSSGTSPVQILVSNTGGGTKADFTTSLGTIYNTAGFTSYSVDLSSFAGQNIKVAFRNIGKAQGFPGLDNVQTATATSAPDLVLESITPTLGSAAAYAATGSPIAVSGVITNNDIKAVSSFNVCYQLGTGAVVREPKTLTTPFWGTYSFTFTTPVTAPAANTDLKIWIELTGDMNHTNDTLKTKVAGYTTKTAKKVFMEEATGTWCGWCPRGLVYMDSIYHKYPSGVAIAAVHNADPMTVSAYDSYISSMVSGYPNMIVDRMYSDDPSGAFDYYSMLSGNYGLADITVTPTITGGNTLTVKADVKPTAQTNNDYKLALVLTEDRVSGTTSGYAQTNYYSGVTLPAYKMTNTEYNFNTLPSPVPAATMKFDFVARGIYPTTTGAAGSLPTAMTAGTSYSYTFSAVTLSSTWNKAKMKAIVLLMNSADNTVINAQVVPIVSASVSEQTAGVNSINIFPNPAADVINAEFTLENKSNVSMEIIDLMGKVVKTIPAQSLNAGTYQVPTSVSDLANGVYVLKIMTENGNATQRFSVTK